MRHLFGRTGRDRIQGFTGVIVGYCEYISGCSQLLLSPRVDDKNTAPSACWYDVQRVEILDDVAPIVLPPEQNALTPGCDMPAPIR